MRSRLPIVNLSIVSALVATVVGFNTLGGFWGICAALSSSLAAVFYGEFKEKRPAERSVPSGHKP